MFGRSGCPPDRPNDSSRLASSQSVENKGGVVGMSVCPGGQPIEGYQAVHRHGRARARHKRIPSAHTQPPRQSGTQGRGDSPVHAPARSPPRRRPSWSGRPRLATRSAGHPGLRRRYRCAGRPNPQHPKETIMSAPTLAPETATTNHSAAPVFIPVPHHRHRTPRSADGGDGIGRQVGQAGRIPCRAGDRIVIGRPPAAIFRPQ